MVRCPKCRRSVLGIGRSFGGRRKLVSVEVHHHEDARRWSLGGHGMKLCKLKMTFEASQRLAMRLSG